MRMGDLLPYKGTKLLKGRHRVNKHPCLACWHVAVASSQLVATCTYGEGGGGGGGWLVLLPPPPVRNPFLGPCG